MGWLCLAAMEEQFGRKIVAWSTSHRLTTGLIASALAMAIGRQFPVAGLLAPSDRGRQLAGTFFQCLWQEQGIACSLSRKGNCGNNSPTERFCATLKKESMQLEDYPTQPNRRHSPLGFMSPAEFERVTLALAPRLQNGGWFI